MFEAALLGIAALLILSLQAWRSGLSVVGRVLAPVIVAGTAIVPPANTVYCGGARYDECVQTYKVGTATNLKAGVFVIKGADDDHIVVAGAGALNVIGVLSEKNWTNSLLNTFTTAPTAEDEVDVILNGSGAFAKVWNAANIAAGSLVASDATGYAVAKAAEIDSDCGRALHDHDGTTPAWGLVVVL